MAEAARYEKSNIEPELSELRLLTEVDHLVEAMRPDGTVPEAVLTDTETNLQTFVNEAAMPLAVSTTIHRVEHYRNDQSRRQRVITWMGKNAVEIAMSGKRFHHTPAAHQRVDIEVAEARHAQDSLRPGVAQAFISPKMSNYDAPVAIAKSEHLHDDDSLRVSYAVTNSQGEVVARRLESLLVRDVPLEAWIAMLTDENNIFGKAFTIRNKQSALSVMELFRDLELPEDKIPEGPVTLVAAVQKYIKDNDAYDSVGRQVEGFRHDQELYRQQAELSAKEWLHFELELAKSLKANAATVPVRSMIVSLQDRWGDEQLRVIASHAQGNTEYKMTRQLAAMLEQAKRNLVRNKAAIATNNQSVIEQIAPARAQELHDKIHVLEMMRASNMISGQEYALRQAEIDRQIAAQNIRGGGGCAGDTSAGFRTPDGTNPSLQTDESDKSHWKWKSGKCQVKTCPSPQPTRVGPCSVCERCQAKFDAGQDPTKANPTPVKQVKDILISPPAEQPEHKAKLVKTNPEMQMATQVDEVFSGVHQAKLEADIRARKSRDLAQLALSH